MKDSSLTPRKIASLVCQPGGLVLLAVVLLVWTVAACGPRQSQIDPSLEQARAKLTEAAALAGTPEGGVDILGTPLAFGTADPNAALQGTVEAANATAQIADVRMLVKGQTPLATFTPDPAGAKPSGRVLYVRGGKFRTVDAGGGGSQELAVKNGGMPAIFAPADDPGRAWSSPDGSRVAFFAGSDAEMWTMRTDGSENVRVSPPNLPTGIQAVTAGGASQDIRFRPKVDYTLVYGAGGDQPFAVLVDDNSRHVKGEGRLRVVHAAPGAGSRQLVAQVNSAPAGSPMRLGRSTGDVRAPAGQVFIVIKDDQGKTVLELAPISLAERELKTVFIVGQDKLEAVQQTYDVVTNQPSNASLVRVFNATTAAVDVNVGDVALAAALAPRTLGGYVVLPAIANVDARTDLEMTVYGLRALERPVAWSPDSRQVAWLGAPAGKSQVFVSPVGGPARQLTEDEREKVNPVWSPGSSALAWIAVDPTYNDQYVGYWKGTTTATMDTAALKSALGSSPTTPLRFSDGVGWVDEHRLFLYPSAEQRSAGIWLFDTRSGTFDQIYDRPISSPDWSPASQAWVFGGAAEASSPVRLEGERPDGEDGSLRVLELGADVAARDLPVQGRFARWLPDGRRISWIEGEPTATDGWAIHVINADGSGDRDLTGKAPLMQADPPVPGPNAKRYWLADGQRLAFARAGVDYGAREETGFADSEAGNDIENLWLVPVDGGGQPKLASDLTKIFYLKELQESPDGGSLAFIAFAYDSRSQQLYAVRAAGGKPVQLDSGVRWFQWLR